MTSSPPPIEPTGHSDGPDARDGEGGSEALGVAVAGSDTSPTRADSRSGTGRPGWPRTLLVTMAAVGLVVTAVLLFAREGSEPAAESADGIFALPFTTSDGGTATLADYGDQPLVVNFFASWCPPCRAELPDFEAAHQQFDGEVTFIGVNQDFTDETWLAFVSETDITYETVFQPGSEIWSEIGTQAMPTTVFISADGEVAEVWGGVLTADKLDELIQTTLLETSS